MGCILNANRGSTRHVIQNTEKMINIEDISNRRFTPVGVLPHVTLTRFFLLVFLLYLDFKELNLNNQYKIQATKLLHAHT